MIHYNDSDYLCHYGVPGMKWGVRKQKYVSTNRGDIALYGQKGANRIKKRMQKKGMSHKKAERRENIRAVAGVAATSAALIALTNPRFAKVLAVKSVSLTGSAVKAGQKIANATGGYSYKNAAKFVAMNLKNKARGVTYL